MNVPESDALLTVWERHHDAHPIRRALEVLQVAWPEVDAESWERAPVGQRDGCLLDLHEALFGPELATTARCPGCSQRLESTFVTSDVRVPAVASSCASPEPRRLSAEGYDVDYRLPSSADLLALDASAGDTDAAVRELLRRCVTAAKVGDRAIEPATLPPSLVVSLGERMASEDPAAEIRLNLTCPGCAHVWQETFDIVRHICGQLEDWAQRTLLDVHTLAGAYGWSERDILALAPSRRQLYVDMVRA